jgi:hypothetical protein
MLWEDLSPDYSADKQTKVCSPGQPSHMVKEMDHYPRQSEGDVGSDKGKRGVFINVTTVLPASVGMA